MEIKEVIRSFAEQIMECQIQAQALWVTSFPWEPNCVVLLSKRKRAEYYAGYSMEIGSGQAVCIAMLQAHTEGGIRGMKQAHKE